MIYAYLRQMPEGNTISDQQGHILSFLLAKGLIVDKEVVEYSGKTHRIEDRKKFEAFMHSLQEGDSLIVDALFVLSHHAEELIKIITCMLSRKIDLFVASSKICIDKDTKIVEVFPLLNDLREAQKAKSNQIGRPKGSRSSSKFDVYHPRIIALLREGLSVSAIARELEVSRSSLKDYIESRGIRALVDGSWMEISQSEDISEVDTTLLICPFEQEQEQKLKGEQP